jgi:tetratricopeptide (TPR) repeat protein
LLSSLIWFLTGNPLLALAILAAIYLYADRRYIGLLPDFTRPFKRRRHMARLAATIRANPADANAQLELGAFYLESNAAARALPLLEKARERNPDSARLHFLLGAAYRRLGRKAEAREALEKAVILNPKVAYGEPYYHLLAIGLYDQPLDEGALTEFRARILSHGSPETFYRAGRALLSAGKHAEAREIFQEAVDNYRASPKGFRRTHRRWAAASKIFLLWSER